MNKKKWQIKQGSNQYGWNCMVSKYELAIKNMVEYQNMIIKTQDPILKANYNAEIEKYRKEKDECDKWLEEWRIDWD